MRFASGSLDESIFAVEVHLNHSGTERLFQHFHLHGLIRFQRQMLKITQHQIG